MANENRYYKTPFGESGDKAEVPDVSVNGAVGYDKGFGPDYALPKGDSSRKRIERNMYNGVKFGITKNIKQWQEGLYPTWIEDNGDSVAFSYPQGMIVSHNDVNYISTEAANQDEPGTGTKWYLFSSGNFNVFKVNADDTLRANNLAISTTVVDVDLPLQSLVMPTSLSTTGTFKVVDSTTDSAIGTGLQPILSFQSSFSNPIARFTASGLTVGRTYKVVAEVNASITVNY